MSQATLEMNFVRLYGQAIGQDLCMVHKNRLSWESFSQSEGNDYNPRSDGAIGEGGLLDPDAPRVIGAYPAPRANVRSHLHIYIPACYDAGVGEHYVDFTPEQYETAKRMMRARGAIRAWGEWCERYPDANIITRKYPYSDWFPVVFAYRKRENAVVRSYPRQVRGSRRIFGIHDALECLGIAYLGRLTYQHQDCSEYSNVPQSLYWTLLSERA